MRIEFTDNFKIGDILITGGPKVTLTKPKTEIPTIECLSSDKPKIESIPEFDNCSVDIEDVIDKCKVKTNSKMN